MLKMIIADSSGRTASPTRERGQVIEEQPELLPDLILEERDTGAV